ncbi:hypothetical protein [Prosthecochloris sp. CIB 2401]|uniref:hypothetical protein n=1 Tax=Prosthecochloris sp. CIB 2401 TaxID=1868325 RepID=UPI00080A9670|nr:hypothetical protein [Prosthecochloris sp. CIB 2401]ANT64649.1 hypothetical protein Ptc2401_00862 [Prosthecochloris sp. CIB 2401]
MSINAVDNATRLDEIGFPEFTASLINSTFDALIAANIRQMAAYADLVKTLGQELSEYINNTKDSISGEEVLSFLERVLPAYEEDKTTKVVEGGELNAEEAKVLTRELALPEEATQESLVVNAGEVNQSVLDSIVEAVALRLACNKYLLLKEMVAQGLLRLVVENGVIETRLNFSAWEYSSSSRKTTDYSRNKSTRTKYSAGGIIQNIISGPSVGRKSSSSLRVKTATEKDYASGGTNINIFGGVRINFKTDYLPLAD